MQACALSSLPAGINPLYAKSDAENLSAVGQLYHSVYRFTKDWRHFMRRSSADLKALARESLNGRIGLPVAAYFLTVVFTFIPVMVITNFLNPYSTVSIITNQILAYIVSLLVSLCSAGFSYMLLNMNRNRTFQIKDLFYPFSSHPDRFLTVHLILLLISFLFSLPLEILSYTDDPYASLMLSLGASLVSSLVSILTGLFFGLADFLMLDDPELGAIDAMKKSLQLMKGNKSRLLYIQLSFLPLYFVGLLTCYLGYLWIMPYVNCTLTYFYMDLTGEIDNPLPPQEEPPHLDASSYY